MQSMALVEALCSEVIRKLRLATEAETKDDREIVCEEVFCDVTGRLDEAAQAQLGAPDSVPFYVVLARHYATPRGSDSAVAVLHLLQSLYGQGYAAPLVALLLHRWLLIRRAPGRGLPEEQRTRVAIALALGSAQLFMGDVHGGARAFEPLWRSLCHEVILGKPAPVWGGDPALQAIGRQGSWHGPSGSGGGAAAGGAVNGLGTLTLTARTGLLAVTAAFLVYYSPVDELEDVLKWFPAPTAPTAPLLPQTLSSSAITEGMGDTLQRPSSPVSRGGAGAERQRRAPLASPPFHGVDFVMVEVVDVLGRISTESGLVMYLKALQRLRGQPALVHADGMRLGTRLKLQSTLTSLAAPGGPNYYPYAVGVQALDTLDSLFPTGTGSRRLVRAVFKLLHPLDWIGDVLGMPLALVRAALSQLMLAAFRLLHALVLWGAWGAVTRNGQQEGAATGGSTLHGRAPQLVTHTAGPGMRRRMLSFGPLGSEQAGREQVGPAGAEVMARSGAATPRATGTGSFSVWGSSARSSPRKQSSPRTSGDMPRGGGLGVGQLIRDDIVGSSPASAEQGDSTRAVAEQLSSAWVVPEPVQAATVQSLVDARPLDNADGEDESAQGTAAAGVWLAARADRRQQLLDHARSAVESTVQRVGSTVTAMESGVKAMGAYLTNNNTG